MAKISYDAINYGQQASSDSSKIGWFSLKNDGDTALVRIMEDSMEGLEILTVHPIKLNEKYVKVNCIRELRDPAEKCPLCSRGNEIQQRAYLKLVVYDPETGEPTPKIWERSASFVKIIQGKLESYGPLSKSLFIIRRCGEKGDLKTTYNIDYAPPQVYPVEKYAPHPEFFAGYTAVGTAVFDKNYDELSYYVSKGEFPSNKSPQENTSYQDTIEMSQPAYAPVPPITPEAPSTANEPAPMQTPAQQTMPWDQPASVQRPKRYY